MEHSTDLLHQAFAALLFCVAVTILLIGYKNYNTALSITKHIITEDTIMYEQYTNQNENRIKRGEIISLFFHPLEYDLEIDGLLISKMENVKENISYYTIADGNYTKHYAYDSDGNITRIIFNSINN